MIDMIGVDDPLDVMRSPKAPPDVVVLHKGRDEEGTRGKVIQYRHVNRIHSKYDVHISAAGGVTLKEARSAIFNGASIVGANLVAPGDQWQGISTTADGQDRQTVPGDDRVIGEMMSIQPGYGGTAFPIVDGT